MTNSLRIHKLHEGSVSWTSKERVLSMFLRVDNYKGVSIIGFDGNRHDFPFDVQSMERGDSAALMLVNCERRTVTFVEQFRLPTFEKTGGWIVETLAGVLEQSEDAAATAKRESVEEVGYRVEKVEQIYNPFYVSPGGTSERIFLFAAFVNDKSRESEGGGLRAEGELIRRVEVTFDQVIQMLHRGEIIDAKTMIAVLWLQNQIIAGKMDDFSSIE